MQIFFQSLCKGGFVSSHKMCNGGLLQLAHLGRLFLLQISQVWLSHSSDLLKTETLS